MKNSPQRRGGAKNYIVQPRSSKILITVGVSPRKRIPQPIGALKGRNIMFFKFFNKYIHLYA
jgi:hypothetical protein